MMRDLCERSVGILHRSNQRTNEPTNFYYLIVDCLLKTERKKEERSGFLSKWGVSLNNEMKKRGNGGHS